MARQPHPRLLLQLLRNANGRRTRQQGFSLAVVLVVLLVGVVGAGTLAIRGNSGNAGSLRLSASRQAREAAESGIIAIIDELNKPRNRRLLVSGTSPSEWASVDPAVAKVLQRNPCLQRTSVVDPKPEAAVAGNNQWKSAGGDGQYVLRSVRFANRDRSQRLQYTYANVGDSSTTVSTTVTDPAYDNNEQDNLNADVNLKTPASGSTENFGYLQLEVQGRVRRNDSTIATATVVKEFQVIPKCCDRSFSGPPNTDGSPSDSFGNDRASCNVASADLGLLFGFNNGTLDLDGKAGSLKQVDASGNLVEADNLDAVLCVTTSATAENCFDPLSDEVTLRSGQIPVVPIALDIAPPPDFDANPALLVNPNINKVGVLELGGNMGRYRYLRVGTSSSSKPEIQVCNVVVSNDDIPSFPALGQGQNPCSKADYCTATKPAPDGTLPAADFYCRMSRIVLEGGSRLFFDSSAGSIALFFDEELKPNSDAAEGTVDVQGNALIRHVYCSTAPAAGTLCNTTAPLAQFSNLAFYGRQSHNLFRYLGTGAGTSLFVYFNKGSIYLGGGTEIFGALWTKDLRIAGNFVSAAPATRCDISSEGLCFFTRGSLSGGLAKDPKEIDWVARSPVTTRLY